MSSLQDFFTKSLDTVTRSVSGLSDSGITDSGLSSRGTSINPPSRQTSTSSTDFNSFFDDYNEERPPPVTRDKSITPVAAQGVPAAAQGVSAAAKGVSAGPQESTKAQQNIDLTEMLVETMQPFFVEILECYEDGFKYISTTPYNTVLADSEKYQDPIIGNLVDRMVCAAIPTFYPIELPNFDPYLASALIKHVLPRLQDFIYDGKCEVDEEPEMTDEEIRDMISNIMPLTSVKESNFEQLCSNFLSVRREAVAKIDKSYSPKNPSMGEIKDFSSPSYVSPEFGGRRQTKKYKKMRSRQTKKNRKNNKVYRGGQRWRVWYMGFLILIFGIGLLCTFMYTTYELYNIKKQVDVSLQTPLVNKIFEIIEMVQQGEKPTQSFSAISYNVTNPESDSTSLVSISPTRTVVDFDETEKFPLSVGTSEIATINDNFLEQLQDNKELFLQLQQISKSGPLELIYLYMSGGFAIDSFELLNKLTTDAAKFLLNGIETVESAKVKKQLVELQKGFESFVEVDEYTVLSKFFTECYASEIGSGNIADAHSLLYVAENYEDYYKLISKVGMKKLMPKPKVVKDFTNGLVRTLVEQNEDYSMTDPETGLQGDQTPVNPVRRFVDLIPGLGTITQKIDSMTETVKKVVVTKELADEKAQCFVRTMQGISKRKFAELDGLKADLKILQLDIGDIIGVEVVRNAFYFILPKGGRLLSCYRAIVALTGLLIGSVMTYGIYKRQAAQGDEVVEVRAELAEFRQGLANADERYEARQNEIMGLLQQALAASAQQPGAQGRGFLPIGNGNNSNSSSSASSNSNPSGSGSAFRGNYSENLTQPSFSSLDYKASNASSATISNASSAAPRGSQSPGRFKGKGDRKPGYGAPDSGGRRTRRRSRQTKKRRRRIKRRQTRKLRRNTKRR
jgi:hypothetical protein